MAGLEGRRSTLSLLFGALLVVVAGIVISADNTPKAPVWSMNATAIEACSCPMFCQCYFNPKPAEHHEGHDMGHFCRFNMAWRVNHGMYGTTKLDGAKFWIAGDLGGDFSKGQMDWAVLTFDPSVTPQQREGITAALGKLFPVKWNSFTVAKDTPIAWNAGKNNSTARLNGGKDGEVTLARFQGMTDEPVVIKNLRYWGAPRNNGFVMMPNKTEAYRVGAKPFEYHGTNGFMITVDLSSKDQV